MDRDGAGVDLEWRARYEDIDVECTDWRIQHVPNLGVHRGIGAVVVLYGLYQRRAVKLDVRYVEASQRTFDRDTNNQQSIRSTPDVVRETLESYVDAGLRHIVLGPASAAISRRSAVYSVRAVFSILRQVRKSANVRLGAE